MEFGEFLRSKRKAKRMSIRQVALYAECSDSYLSLLERGKVGTRGPSPQFLRKLVRPLGVPYEVLMAVAGYTMQTEDDLVYSGSTILMLRESLGDEIEDFSRRVAMSEVEIHTMERNGVGYETFSAILQKILVRNRMLTSRQKQLIQRMEDTFHHLPDDKSFSVELLLHALLDMMEV